MGKQFSASASVTLVCGATGSGKTSFAIRYLLNTPAHCRFVWDPEGEFAARLKVSPCRSPMELETSLLRGWVCFDPSQIFGGDLRGAFSFFCEWAIRMSERMASQRKIFVVDELWRYCHPGKIPKELAEIVNAGRGRRLELLAITQRPNRIHADILSQVTEFVGFHLSSRSSLETIEHEFEIAPDEMRRLPKLHFIGKDMVSGGLCRGSL